MRSIIVPANDEDPTPVVEFVSEELEQYDYSSRALYQIEVAIEEILVNIVTEDAGEIADIHVALVLHATHSLAGVHTLEDDGIPFDPLAKEDPDTSLEANMEREGGLGIFMVKQLMDDVSYVYEDGKNVLTIQKNL